MVMSRSYFVKISIILCFFMLTSAFCLSNYMTLWCVATMYVAFFL